MKPVVRLQELAYMKMREKVLSRQFERGVIYSETKLAEEIGISRTPMRDALQRLCQEGYLDIIPSKGFMLHKLDADDLEETYHIRCAIEGYCMQMISGKASTKKGMNLLNKLEKLIGKQAAVLERNGSSEAFSELDQQFHSTIVSFAGCAQFNDLFGSHTHRIYQFAVNSFEQEGRMDEAIQEHRQMLFAAKNGRSVEAYQATLYHMDALRKLTLEHLNTDKGGCCLQ